MSRTQKLHRFIWIIRAAYHLGRYVDGWSWSTRISLAKDLWVRYGGLAPEEAVIEDISYWYE